MRILEWRVPPYDNGTYVVIDDRREALGSIRRWANG